MEPIKPVEPLSVLLDAGEPMAPAGRVALEPRPCRLLSEPLVGSAARRDFTTTGFPAIATAADPARA